MQPALDWANPEDFEFDFSDNWDGDLGSSNFPSQNEQTKRDLPPDLKYLNMLHEQASDCEKLEIAKQREQLKLDTIKSNGRVELLKIELERTRLRHASEKPI